MTLLKSILKFDIKQEYKRQVIQKEQSDFSIKNVLLQQTGKVLSNPKSYQRNGKMMRAALKYLPRFFFYNNINTWTIGRDLPDVPKESFKEWYQKNRSYE